MEVDPRISENVKLTLKRLCQHHPIEKILASDENLEILASSRLKSAVKNSSEFPVPVKDVWVTIDDAYLIGAGCLSLRSKAVNKVGFEKYSNEYRKLSKNLGLDIAESGLRRRAMYLPILGDEDTLVEIVSFALLASKRGRDYQEFLLVKTMDRVKELSFVSGIDWAPFGGPV